MKNADELETVIATAIRFAQAGEMKAAMAGRRQPLANYEYKYTGEITAALIQAALPDHSRDVYAILSQGVSWKG